MLGDLNCDHVVNLRDVEPFVLALTNLTEYQKRFPACSSGLADMDGDGFVDGRDIQVFVQLLVP